MQLTFLAVTCNLTTDKHASQNFILLFFILTLVCLLVHSILVYDNKDEDHDNLTSTRSDRGNIDADTASTGLRLISCYPVVGFKPTCNGASSFI